MKERYLLNITTTNLNVEKTHDFTFRTEFLHLDPEKKFSIALLNYSLWYSWYNITTLNNNFRYVVSGVVKDIVIPSGNYGVGDLNTYIQSQLTLNGDSPTGVDFTGNYNTLKVDMTLEPTYDVDFTIANSFSAIFGFNQLLYENNGASNLLISGQNAANITNSIDAITINCSILDTRYNITNGATSVCLHQFVPQSGPGSNLSASIPTPIYLPISSSGSVKSFQVSIRDQAQNLLNLNGEHISISLLIRED